MTATITEDETRLATTDEPGNATHIVLVPKHLKGSVSPQAYVMEARVSGTEIEALCGHRWVPQRDPKALPVCTKCLTIYQNDPKGHGDRDDLPEA